ncbi:MAG TPA: hypothetical protein VGS23_03770, partial [Thermoplasmata archaeon]|nr:hypothetical protein [Thermoplasmata archaeon]
RQAFSTQTNSTMRFALTGEPPRARRRRARPVPRLRSPAMTVPSNGDASRARLSRPYVPT